jgi:hypothetical protein
VLLLGQGVLIPLPILLVRLTSGGRQLPRLVGSFKSVLILIDYSVTAVLGEVLLIDRDDGVPLLNFALAPD